jgi:hypothetical protein
MVGAAVEVVFPCPGIFEGHELVDVDFVAVNQSFLIDTDAFACCRIFCHIFYPIFSYWQLSQVSSPILQAFGAGSSLSILMLLEADLLFIQRG